MNAMPLKGHAGLAICCYHARRLSCLISQLAMNAMPLKGHAGLARALMSKEEMSVIVLVVVTRR